MEAEAAKRIPAKAPHRSAIANPDRLKERDASFSNREKPAKNAVILNSPSDKSEPNEMYAKSATPQ